MDKSEESAKNITFVNKENNNNTLNDPNTSRLALTNQSSGLESLNLIDIKNNKFRKPKAKFNIINKSKKDNEVHERIPYNPKIKYTQKIIFIPLVFILITIPFCLWETSLINYTNMSDKTYVKYLVRFLLILIYLCYLLSVFTSPSQTNIYKTYKLNNDSFKKLDNIFNKDLWNEYCLNCQSQKFIRSVHCNICGECVLLKFKHCFFIANCIGFKNIQYVINFLVLSIILLYKFECSCLMFFKMNNISNILITIDFIINIPLLSFLLSNLILLLFDIYNNQTKLERSNKNKLIEKYYMFYKCNDTDNKFRFPNIWNIGYLSHFYYIIGPTILHFLFPLPKVINYNISENCPIFKGSKQFNRLELIQNMIKRSDDYKDKIKDNKIEPDIFVELCKKKINSKNIK